MRIIGWFKSQNRGTRQFIGLCVIPLVAVMIISGIVALVAGASVGSLVNMSLTFLWMIAVFSYIVFFDSKRRWPKVGASDRFANLMTFKR